MVKAHSLLYAIYICLIVSIICGSLLYFSTLYTQLNVHYNLHEELYLHNQSIVNFALGNKLLPEEIPQEESSGIKASFESKQHGLLTLIIAKSSLENDTIKSAHFVGSIASDFTAIYLPSFSKSLTYSGQVKIIGDKRLPSPFIAVQYINGEENNLISTGKSEISESILPEINKAFKNNYLVKTNKLKRLDNIEKMNDSVYFNSFLNPAIELQLSSPILANIAIKGNFIIHSTDSIHVQKSAILEDVILKAPRITFSDGFTGNVQAFSTERIEVGKRAVFGYPSILCVYNPDTTVNATIVIKEQSQINGAVVLFGSRLSNIEENTIVMHKDTKIIGDIYCTGKFMIQGTLYGSIYTNRFFNKLSQKDNCIINAVIDATKKPNYFISIPLFDSKKTDYGILKKVF